MAKSVNTDSHTSKPLTLEDLARQIGVSRSLVSIAFTGKGRIAADTREKILSSARELGYEPHPDARRLAGGRCPKTVALICNDLDAGIGTHKINQLQQALSRRGYKVPVFACGFVGRGDTEFQVEMLRDVRRQKPRAIVCSVDGLQQSALQELKAYQDEGGVVVSYDHPTSLQCDKVVFDRAENTYLATCHLLELGHREIGLYVHGPQEENFGKRGEGFRRALAEFGVEANSLWMFSGGLYEQGGAALVEPFLVLPEKPSGLVILNDNAAFGFVHEALRQGMCIPDELSIVGHDDNTAASFCPVPLTTVSHPHEAIVDGIAQLLCERLDGVYDGPARTLNIQGEIIQRQSAKQRN